MKVTKVAAAFGVLIPGLGLDASVRSEFPAAACVQVGYGSSTGSAGKWFAIEGHTLLDVLKWFAPRACLDVVYSDAATRLRAGTIVIHGHAEGLSPRDTILAILVGTDLTYSIEGGRLWVGLPGDSRRLDRVEIRCTSPFCS